MNIRLLFDGQKKDENEKPKNSFVGGEKSGLSVEHPGSLANDFACESSIGSGPPPPGARKISLYKNGFCVDGGDFRSFDDPENVDFINSVKAGYAPKELRDNASGPVTLVLEDLRSTTFEPLPPPKYVLFSGEGKTTDASARTVPSIAVDTSRATVALDASQPITTLAFRFYNGTSIRQQFNESHTIADIHNFVFRIAPVESGYQLLYGFPPRRIPTDPSLTLKAAGLLNETFLQRLST